MEQRIVQVDAFADAPFRGNPAAVCVLQQAATDAWMQNVAREMNLSETAFLQARPDGWGLRWFTPAVEVDLCGHATLASAHVLWEDGLLDARETARFHTRSGVLTAVRDGAWIELDFPGVVPEPVSAPAGLLEALGIDRPHAVARNRFDYLIEVDSAATVRALDPDMTRLRRVEARGVIVTASGDNGYDVVSRFFAPAAGVNEDPVTGSAHCAIGPWWAGRLGNEMTAFQASARGGVIGVRVVGDRVRLRGRAVTVMEGILRA